jgi:putative dimethyl sulfoxide reductase chaperone
MFTNTELKLHTDFSSILKSRLYINRLIRFIFDTPPEKEGLQTVAEDPRFLYLCEISLACQTIQDGITSLLFADQSFFCQAKEEYNRLFVGLSDLPVPLWESVYLSNEHTMLDEQTLHVRECYKQHNLFFENCKNEDDDHIVIELEFLDYLIGQMLLCTDIETKHTYLDEQLSFLNNHLLKWIPQFCELLGESTEVEIYKGAALLLDEYIQLEIELIMHLEEDLPYE